MHNGAGVHNLEEPTIRALLGTLLGLQKIITVLLISLPVSDTYVSCSRLEREQKKLPWLGNSLGKPSVDL